MIQELNVNNFDQEINKDKPVVVEFYTTACSHCKKLAGALNKLSEEKGDDVFFGKCNIDQEALLQSRFDISAVPTLPFIKNGEIKNRLVGEVHLKLSGLFFLDPGHFLFHKFNFEFYGMFPECLSQIIPADSRHSQIVVYPTALCDLCEAGKPVSYSDRKRI